MFPIRVRYLIIACLLLASLESFCQKDSISRNSISSEDSVQHKSASFHGHAALIVSSAFSNYPLGSSDDEVSGTTYRPVDTVSKFKPGFLLGIDMHFLKTENFNMILGISFSRTKALYHSTYISEGPTSRPGFTSIVRTTESDITLNYSALNFQGGFRRRIADNFFGGLSFLVNSPTRITRSMQSSTESKYVNNSGGSETDKIYINSGKTALKQKPMGLSIRLTADYDFTFGETEASVYLFRNFGILYALPWWGIGFKFSLGG